MSSWYYRQMTRVGDSLSRSKNRKRILQKITTYGLPASAAADVVTFDNVPTKGFKRVGEYNEYVAGPRGFVILANELVYANTPLGETIFTVSSDLDPDTEYVWIHNGCGPYLTKANTPWFESHLKLRIAIEERQASKKRKK